LPRQINYFLPCYDFRKGWRPTFSKSPPTPTGAATSLIPEEGAQMRWFLQNARTIRLGILPLLLIDQRDSQAILS
jgi:hypothetical protein